MSKTRENPFPGMNPYMEEDWPDIHARLIAHAAGSLQRQLPGDLITRVEHDLKVGAAEDDNQYRADVTIREPWSEEVGGGVAVLAAPIALAKPIIAPAPRPHRRIAIMDTRGHLITVIEILSPTNKKNRGLIQYITKRADLMDSGVNLVEVDLVRAGGLITTLLESDEATKSLGEPTPPHVVMVFRGHGCDERALYPVRYQQPLPAFAVPLRAGERDVVLDLPSILQQCFEDAALWHSDYRLDPKPPLSPADQAWLDELLRAKGLR